jgi:WD40 repeat protein
LTVLFTPQQATLRASCETPGILFGLCRDPEDGRLYGAGTDGFAYVIDPTAEKPIAEKKWRLHENFVSSMAFNDGVIISGGFDRRLVWTNVADGNPIRTIEAHDGWVRDLALFPDRERLVSVGDDMQVKIWNRQTGELTSTLEGHAKKTPQGYATALYAVSVSPDGKTIASGDRIGEVCLWEADSGKFVRRLKAPGFYTYDPLKRVRSIGGIRSVAFSPDGLQLAIGGIGQVTNVDGFVGPCRVELWDWRAGKRVFAGEDSHKAVVNHVAFHPARSWLIGAGGGDSGGILAFWDRKATKAVHKAKPKGHLQRFLLDANSEQLLAVGYGGFQIWSFRAKEPPAEKNPAANSS